MAVLESTLLDARNTLRNYSRHGVGEITPVKSGYRKLTVRVAAERSQILCSRAAFTNLKTAQS
jgi:hypothetical protein